MLNVQQFAMFCTKNVCYVILKFTIFNIFYKLCHVPMAAKRSSSRDLFHALDYIRSKKCHGKNRVKIAMATKVKKLTCCKKCSIYHDT